MSEYDNEKRGVLFKNDKEGVEARPDYKGTVTVNGAEYWLSAWIKESKAGNKYMSLSLQEKDQEYKPAQQDVLPNTGDDESVPF